MTIVSDLTAAFRCTKWMRLLPYLINAGGIGAVFLIIRYCRETDAEAVALLVSNAFVLVTLHVLVGTLKVEFHPAVRKMSSQQAGFTLVKFSIAASVIAAIMLKGVAFLAPFQGSSHMSMLLLAGCGMPAAYVIAVRGRHRVMANLLRVGPVPLGWGISFILSWDVAASLALTLATISLITFAFVLWQQLGRKTRQDKKETTNVIGLVPDLKARFLFDLLNFCNVNFLFYYLQYYDLTSQALTFFEYSRFILAPLNLFLFPITQKVTATVVSTVGGLSQGGRIAVAAPKMLFAVSLTYISLMVLGFVALSSNWLSGWVQVFTDINFLLFILIAVLSVPRALAGVYFPLILASDELSFRLMLLTLGKTILFCITAALILDLMALMVVMIAIEIATIAFVCILLTRIEAPHGTAD